MMMILNGIHTKKYQQIQVTTTTYMTITMNQLHDYNYESIYMTITMNKLHDYNYESIT